MLRIAITGASGLVGSRIVELLKDEFEFIDLPYRDLDITKNSSVREKFKNLDFDILFHLAGYTNVDKAEIEKERAHAINIEGTRNLFEATNRRGKKFIYISTDFVFDGIRGQDGPPYFEDSKPHPLGYYAQTKYEGEKIVSGQAMIVRIAYPYCTQYELKKDFVKSIKSQLESGKILNMVTDSLITPTFIDDIAYALRHLFKNYSSEIFHIVGSNSVSPFEAGKHIAKTFQLDEKLILPTTFQEYARGKAARSQYSEIKSKKNNFYSMKSFEEGLAEVVKQIRYNLSL